MKNNPTIILLALLLLLVFVMLLSSALGGLYISIPTLFKIIGHQFFGTAAADFNSAQEMVFLNIRLPRIILGMLVGAGLAISGAAIQGLFRNPLAEPSLIGISSGASLFAVLMIVLDLQVFRILSGILGFYALSIVAFLGACLTTFVVYRMALKKGKTDIGILLLAGISINAIAGACTGLLTYTATDEQLRNITFWNLGSLGGASWQSVTGLLPFCLIPILLLPFKAKALNAFALGEAQAAYMGTSVTRTKRTIIVLATLAVGGAVAVAGIISFVGLVVPHILRLAFGANHKLLLPASALLGASVLSLADLIARTIVSPQELPIGILTALIGGPIFLSMILSQRKNKFK